jgi:hypothetical protein
VQSDWAVLHAWRREPEKAAELARRSLALAEQATFGLWVHRADLVLRWAEAHLEPTITPERAEQMVSVPGEGAALGRTPSLILFASMCARLGHTPQALDVIAKGLAAVEQGDERWLEAELHRLRGEILAPTDPKVAERSFATAVDVARRQGATLLELRATVSWHASLSGAKKKRAREDIARLVGLVTGGLDTPDVTDALRAVES